MTDDEFKAFLNTMMNGFQETVKAVSRNSSDHDLLIRMDTRLEQALAENARNHKEFLQCKASSVAVRDDVNKAIEHVTLCKQECHGDMIKKHDGFIKGTVKALWVIFGIAFTALVKAFWK